MTNATPVSSIGPLNARTRASTDLKVAARIAAGLLLVELAVHVTRQCVLGRPFAPLLEDSAAQWERNVELATHWLGTAVEVATVVAALLLSLFSGMAVWILGVLFLMAVALALLANVNEQNFLIRWGLTPPNSRLLPSVLALTEIGIVAGLFAWSLFECWHRRRRESQSAIAPRAKMPTWCALAICVLLWISISGSQRFQSAFVRLFDPGVRSRVAPLLSEDLRDATEITTRLLLLLSAVLLWRMPRRYAVILLLAALVGWVRWGGHTWSVIAALSSRSPAVNSTVVAITVVRELRSPLPLTILFAFSLTRTARRLVMPQPGFCAACGYDLTGNVSGVCPECGTAVPAPAPVPQS